MHHTTIRSVFLLACVLLFSRGLAADGSLPARTALDDYIARKDSVYDWRQVESSKGEGFTVFLLELTSQSWRSREEVDRTVWKHWIRLVRPDRLEHDTALLVIGGGKNGGRPPGADGAGRYGAIGVATGAVVAELRMVPNQPLAFSDDGRPRFEDDLVAHTWNKFMDTGDPTWVARMPMVKSAVRAMDAVQEFMKSDDGGAEIREFVVAGGSKRGWTTWLTGAVDRRVSAIVPIVIDVVNVVPSMEHHYAAYGFWAPAVGDYQRNGIMDRRKDPAYEKLLRLVDPYYYRHRLALPKFIINSSGDQFFLPDSSQFYFDDLRGEKYLRYVPNTDHSLRDSDAAESLTAFFHAVITETPRPQLSWKLRKNGSIVVRAKTEPSAVLLWQASNPETRDFRLETIGKAWTSRTLSPRKPGRWVARVEKPEKGWTAFFAELTFPIAGSRVPLKLTTPVRVVPDTLPFAGKLDELDAKARGEREATEGR